MTGDWERNYLDVSPSRRIGRFFKWANLGWHVFKLHFLTKYFYLTLFWLVFDHIFHLLWVLQTVQQLFSRLGCDARSSSFAVRGRIFGQGDASFARHIFARRRGRIASRFNGRSCHSLLFLLVLSSRAVVGWRCGRDAVIWRGSRQAVRIRYWLMLT